MKSSSMILNKSEEQIFDLEDTAYEAIQKYKNRPEYMKTRTMSDLFKDGFNEGVKSDEAKAYWYRFFKQEIE